MQFVNTFENFLSEELYEESIKTARHLINSPSMCFATHKWWDEYIVRDSFPVLLHSINKESDFFGRLKSEILEKIDPVFNEYKQKYDDDIEVMFYYWTRFSYIPWHDDANYQSALTIYLNEQWDLDWGGLFMYRKENEPIIAIPPDRNTAVMQFGGVMHSTTPVNYDGQLRITLQVFFNKE